jgi:positive regulator of sigma E activity
MVDPSRADVGWRPTATVVRSGPNLVVVEVVPAQACAGCRVREGCTGLRLAPTDAPVTANAVNRCDARPGQTVTLGSPAGVLAMSAVLVYLLPAVTVVAGAALGAVLGPRLLGCSTDPAAAAGAGLGLLCGLGLLHLLDACLAGRPAMRVEAVSVVGSEEAR